MPNGSFTGRTVLVFGAAGALGAGVAAAFGAAGAAVIGVDRAVPDGGRQLDGVRYEAADVLDDAALDAFFGAASAPWAVVNTVGGFAPRRPLADLDPAELTGQLQLNLVSAALITKHARCVQAAGEGRIVHTASRAAVVTKGAGFRTRSARPASCTW
jgi:NAD(P)-dependent dehydrogenase (short-subunit alcohol dehydrogenase family)